MRIVITGGNGFIGRNLFCRLRELKPSSLVSLSRESPWDTWEAALRGADFVFHLAGVNRTTGSEAEFYSGNVELTARVCQVLESAGRSPTLVYASSTQAVLDNHYGRSKALGEDVVRDFAVRNKSRGIVFRLPNVFGKWARPNYNSVVATFCYNLNHGLPLSINDPNAELNLLYIDDLADQLVELLGSGSASGLHSIRDVYQTSVGELAATLRAFSSGRAALEVPNASSGMSRALYATFISYLPTRSFAYSLTPATDKRGLFSEVFRTEACGQFSFFTAHPGVTRGNHYHHTKTEKFLVVQGKARFIFRNVSTAESFKLDVEGTVPQIVETIPGWAHSIQNIGSTELIALLWANERFDPKRPDTIPFEVEP
jgi:UDP-2-acetamido-2,6-beta-L-arabino-hexul-4-ose reductase